MTPSKDDTIFSPEIRVTDKRGKAVAASNASDGMMPPALSEEPTPLKPLIPDVETAHKIFENLNVPRIGDQFYQGDFLWQVQSAHEESLEIKPIGLAPGAAKKVRRILAKGK